MTQPIDIAALEALEKSATPAPWYAHNPDDGSAMNLYCVTTSEKEPDTEEKFCPDIVALTLYQSPRVVDHEAGRWAEDAALIAATRNALPSLLAELRESRTRGENEEWREKPLPEDAAIDAAHPVNSGNHERFQEALRLVGARHSKYALVALVNWLLAERDARVVE